MNFQVLIIAGLMVAAGAFIVKGQIDARIVAEISATSERTRADLSEKQVERLEAALVADRERQALLLQELDKARANESESTAVLQDRKRLDRLTSLKPGRIEIKARKATTAVWKSIEAEANQ